MHPLSARLKAVLDLEPETGFILFKDNWYSFAYVRQIIDTIDRHLTAAGLGQGSAIGIMLRNRPWHVAAELCLLITGRCLVTINPILPQIKLLEDLRKLNLAAVIGDEQDWAVPEIAALAREIGSFGLKLSANTKVPVEVVQGLDKVGPGPHHEALPGVCIEMLTSGTTGTPKRVRLTFDRLYAAVGSATHYEKRDRLREAPRLSTEIGIFHSPLVHSAGLWGLVFGTVGGNRFELLERFELDAWHKAVLRHKPKVLGAPPAAVRMILDANIPKEDFASALAFRSGTAAIDPDTAEEFEARYGIPVLQVYGATEFAGGVAGWTMKDYKEFGKQKRGSVGLPHPGITLRVVDQNDFHVLPPGEIGLLEIKAKHLGDDWVRTTDLALIDNDGFLFIKGRADNAIIRGGFKIMPEDVVAVLEQIPEIREASVVGIPDRRLGQVPVAAYVLREGAREPAEAEIAAFCRERLKPYEVPVKFKCVPDLPRTPSFKVSQPGVRELFAA